jgi:hypothetical protein
MPEVSEVTSCAEVEAVLSGCPGVGAGRFLWKLYPPAANQARAYPIRNFVCSLPDYIVGCLIGAEQ